MLRLEPDLVWLEGRFRRDVAVTIDPEGGRIASVGPEMSERASGSGDQVQRVALRRKALLPGFVNAHSHAFQRLIRGRTQWRPVGGAGREDFWSWREAMYAAALGLSAEDVYHVSRFCFLEMLRTGITAVGEFHYLHHRQDGEPYPDPNELAARVIAAAESVGLRIVLLNVCYATGGIGIDLSDRQRRFRAQTAEEFLDRTDALRVSVRSSSLATVGVAPHSLRAVPRVWLPRLGAWAAEHDLPLHMHVAEQPAEIEATTRAFGLRPVELLAEDSLLDERFTAVHATHLTDEEVAVLGGSGATVCACPTTERDLGDGFLRGSELLATGGRLALGTDSHTNLDFLEEMRLLEYHERLQRLQRVVLGETVGDRLEVAPALVRAGTRAGADSLRLDAGDIRAGSLADLVAVDLDHLSLAGWTEQTLGAMLTLSGTPEVVSDVWVHGQRRVEEREHPLAAEVVDGFRQVASRGA